MKYKKTAWCAVQIVLALVTAYLATSLNDPGLRFFIVSGWAFLVYMTGYYEGMATALTRSRDLYKELSAHYKELSDDYTRMHDRFFSKSKERKD